MQSRIAEFVGNKARRISKRVLQKNNTPNFPKNEHLRWMMYIRAERKGDFALHLYACHKMMPCFFTAGDTNYARYGLCYLRTIHKLPGYILDDFMNGEHVMHH